MNRTENEDTVDAFLSRHADFSAEAFSLPGADAPDGMLTCYPHRMKGEGHFVALLRKHGDAPCNWQKAPEKDAPSKEPLQALHTFCPTASANVMRTGSGKPGSSRDESVTLSYLARPSRSATAFRSSAAALQLGTVQKKLFVPRPRVGHEHLSRRMCRVWNSRGRMRAAIRRARRSPADGKGWALACCDGIPLGWGKNLRRADEEPLSEGITPPASLIAARRRSKSRAQGCLPASPAPRRKSARAASNRGRS